MVYNDVQEFSWNEELFTQEPSRFEEKMTHSSYYLKDIYTTESMRKVF